MELGAGEGRVSGGAWDAAGLSSANQKALLIVGTDVDVNYKLLGEGCPKSAQKAWPIWEIAELASSWVGGIGRASGR